MSRLIERKGLQFVISKMGKIIKDNRRKIKLIVVGDGPYRKQLESLVIENHLEQYIIFEGYKDKAEIVKYYQEADIFILPSQKEGMPNVVLEAMACGLPIVISPCEGSEELVTNNGIIVEQERFVDELGKLLQDSLLMKEMAFASRKKAVEEFSWKGIVAQYLELFQQCLG